MGEPVANQADDAARQRHRTLCANRGCSALIDDSKLRQETETFARSISFSMRRATSRRLPDVSTQVSR
jgi:hypothetical protein